MDPTLPLVDESSSSRATHLPRNAPFRSCFKRALGGICSGWTSAIEFIQFGTRRLAPESMPPHLKIGNIVEMIEDDGHTFVEATIVDISIGNGMILVKSSCDGSKDNFSLLQNDKVRPVLPHSNDTEHEGMGPHPRFIIYDRVDVLISGKWMTGVIVHSPTSSEDSYHVQVFRKKDKFDKVVTLTTKVRLHFEWDRSGGWNNHAIETNDHPLNQAVGLFGRQRAKVVKILDADHAVVEFCDLKNSDGTHVKEVIRIRDWYKSRFARGLKKLRYWLAPTDDPLREFECYMPAYICLAMLGVVSPVLFTSSAENWPDDMLLVFYLLGGLCCFASLMLVVGVMYWQPTTRAQLRIWRLICLTSVGIGVAFLTVNAVCGDGL